MSAEDELRRALDALRLDVSDPAVAVIVRRLVWAAVDARTVELKTERDALAAAVDRGRRRHPRGDEESGLLAPGKWCPTCGRERSDNGYGACPDRAALTEPDLQETP